MRARLFHVDMFTGLGGEDSGRGVPMIRRGDKHRFHTVELEHFAKVTQLLRFDAGVGLDHVCGVGAVVGIRIADKRDLGVLALNKIPDVAAPHAAGADDAQRHLVIGAGGPQAAGQVNGGQRADRGARGLDKLPPGRGGYRF